MLTPILKPAAIIVDYAATTGTTIAMSKFFTIATGATPTFNTCKYAIDPVEATTYAGSHWIEGTITSVNSVFTIITKEPSSGSNQLGIGQSITIQFNCKYASATGTVPLTVNSGTMTVTIKPAPNTDANKPVKQPTAPTIANLTNTGVSTVSQTIAMNTLFESTTINVV